MDAMLNLVVCITEGIPQHGMNVTLFCHIMLIRCAILFALLQGYRESLRRRAEPVVCIITEGIPQHGMNVTLFWHIMLIRRAILVAVLQARLQRRRRMQS